MNQNGVGSVCIVSGLARLAVMRSESFLSPSPSGSASLVPATHGYLMGSAAAAVVSVAPPVHSLRNALHGNGSIGMPNASQIWSAWGIAAGSGIVVPSSGLRPWNIS